MKILIVNNFFTPFGGAENSTYNTATVLRKNNHEVYFFSTDRKPYIEENYEHKHYFPEYVPYSSLSKKEKIKFLPRFFYNPEAKEKIELFLEKIKPDIIHLNCIHNHLTHSILTPIFKRNIPTVMTIRGPEFFCPSSNLMIGMKEYCKKEHCIKGNTIQCILNNCSGNNERSVLNAVEFANRKRVNEFKHIDKYICASNSMLLLAERSGIQKDKLTMINNFVEDEMLNKLPEYSNKGYILFVGRLEKQKGVHYLLDAMVDHPDIMLHIVGDGKEKQNLEKQVKELNLSNIKFFGFLQGAELEEQYRHSIATVLPCNWFEAFGLTNIESFIYGKPVIASRIGGIPEIIEDSVNGFLTTPGSSLELSEAIGKLCYNQTLITEMGKKGNEKAHKLYNSEIHYNKLINLYESLINDKQEV